MIYLDPNNNKIKKALKNHEQGLFKIIARRVKKCSDDNIKAFLTDKIVFDILVGSPSEIIKINNDFYKKMHNSSSKGYSQFLVNIDKNVKNITPAEKKNLTIYKAINLYLEEIFNYSTSFSVKSTKYSAYTLADSLDINSCVYCNRMYTKTIIKPNKTTRPEFDHWFPKKNILY